VPVVEHLEGCLSIDIKDGAQLRVERHRQYGNMFNEEEIREGREIYDIDIDKADGARCSAAVHAGRKTSNDRSIAQRPKAQVDHRFVR
jgi:hypothetical protein